MAVLTCDFGTLFGNVAKTDKYFNRAVLTIKICRDLEKGLAKQMVRRRFHIRDGLKEQL